MNVSVTKRKRKRGTAVMLDYWADGRRVQKVFGTSDTAEGLALLVHEAETKAKRIELELLDGKHRPRLGEEAIEVALVNFFEHLKLSNKKPATVRSYRETIKKFRTFLKGTTARRLKDVTPALVIRFVQWQDGLAADSICAHLTRLKRIFRRCVEQGAIAINPFKHPDVRDVWPQPVKHERSFTDEELTTFLDMARNDKRSTQAADYADFFMLLSDTGLRVGEGLMLRWCDVRLGEPAYLRVEPHNGWTPKTKSSVRTVPLSPRVVDMLRARLRGHVGLKPQEAIFPDNWCNTSVNTCFNHVLTQAKLDDRDDKNQKLRVHSLRHYFATRLVVNGADPATVRDLLGHESIVTTNRYFNTPRAELFSAIQKAFASQTRHRNVTDSSGLERFGAENVVPLNQ